MALLMPAYSLILIYIYTAPQAYPILEALLTLVEGFCVYSFFKFTILSAQGRYHLLKTLRDSEYTQPCCHYFQKVSTGCCFSTIYLALWQFFIIRPILVLIAGIAEIHNVDSFYKIFTALSLLSLVIAMVALIRMYQTIGSIAKHLYPERKILFLKGIILLFQIQDQILAGTFTKPRFNLYVYVYTVLKLKCFILL
jgi:hypothetical protein